MAAHDAHQHGTSASRIEVWVTGPHAAALDALTGQLEQHGAVQASAPWMLQPRGGTRPELPWTVVLDAPAGIDPTLVSGVAHEHGCRYHPCGGAHRWTDAHC